MDLLTQGASSCVNNDLQQGDIVLDEGFEVLLVHIYYLEDLAGVGQSKVVLRLAPHLVDLLLGLEDLGYLFGFGCSSLAHSREVGTEIHKKGFDEDHCADVQ